MAFATGIGCSNHPGSNITIGGNMEKISLQSAFTKRARLTKEYDKIVGLINSTPYSMPCDATGVVLKEPKYKLDDLLGRLDQIGYMLALFNAAIDKANANSKARECLNHITHLRRKCNSVRRLAQYQDMHQDNKIEYDQYARDDKGNSGNYVTKFYKAASETDFTAELESLERTIRKYEDDLQEINHTTMVEVPDEVAKVLEAL